MNYSLQQALRYSTPQETHPLWRNLEIEHTLRHLEQDPSASSAVGPLAHRVRTAGDLGALRGLADELQESGHPFFNKFNWGNIPKVAVRDAAVRDLATNIAAFHQMHPAQVAQDLEQGLRSGFDSLHENEVEAAAEGLPNPNRHLADLRQGVERLQKEHKATGEQLGDSAQRVNYSLRTTLLHSLSETSAFDTPEFLRRPPLQTVAVTLPAQIHQSATLYNSRLDNRG